MSSSPGDGQEQERPLGDSLQSGAEAAPIVLITGCGSGIGLATAKAFAQAGYMVVATSRRPGESRSLLDLQASSEGRVIVRPLDVSDDAARADAVDWIQDSLGSLDVLINNAGKIWTGSFEASDQTQFESILHTNVLGPMDLTRRTLPLLQKTTKGRVINISAIGGVLPAPFLTLYVATKHALEGMSASLDIELAPSHIRILTLLPGLVKTPIVRRNRSARASDSKSGEIAELWLDQLERRIQSSGVSPTAIAEQIVDLAQLDDPPQKTLYGTSQSSIQELVEHLLTLSHDLRTGHEEFVHAVRTA